MSPRDRTELDVDRPDDEPDEPPFSEIVRDFVAFEVKLFLDGLKDIVLAPGAVVAVFLGLLRKHDRGAPLRAIMRLGDRFERWLGLYRPLSRHEDELEDAPFGGANRALREAERQIRKRRQGRDAEE